MNTINSNSSISNINNSNDIQSINKENKEILNKTSEGSVSSYNPNGLEAKANQDNFSSSFLRTTLQASFTQPSDLKARSKVEGVDSGSPVKSPVVSTKSESTSKTEYDINKIPGLKNNSNVTPEFLAKVETIAKELDTEPTTILAIISFETISSFAPNKQNSKTKATGLIQFLPSTAQSLLSKRVLDSKIDINDKKKIINSLPVDDKTKGELMDLATKTKELPIRKEQLKTKIDSLTIKTKDLNDQLKKAKNLPKEQQDKIKSQLGEVIREKSALIKEKDLISKELNSLPKSIDSKITKDAAIEAFKEMSSTEQLDYVKDYLLPYKGKLDNPQAAYLSVLYPKAVSKSSNPDAIVFSEGSDEYAKNRNLDGSVNGKKDGIITVQEATKTVVDFLKNARR